jgi:hypothetical protein
VEAKEEMKNEQNIQAIEAAWKTEAFDVLVYKKASGVAEE